MIGGGLAFSAVLRADIEGDPFIKLETDSEGNKYFITPKDSHVFQVRTGVRTLDLREGEGEGAAGTYIVCAYDIGSRRPGPEAPPSFFTNNTEITVEVKPGTKVYHGQKIARAMVMYRDPNGSSEYNVSVEELVEFMSPNIKYEV